MVEGDGFEPSKAVPADLQSVPLATREPSRVCLTLHKVLQLMFSP